MSGGIHREPRDSHLSLFQTVWSWRIVAHSVMTWMTTQGENDERVQPEGHSSPNGLLGRRE